MSSEPEFDGADARGLAVWRWADVSTLREWRDALLVGYSRTAIRLARRRFAFAIAGLGVVAFGLTGAAVGIVGGYALAALFGAAVLFGWRWLVIAGRTLCGGREVQALAVRDDHLRYRPPVDGQGFKVSPFDIVGLELETYGEDIVLHLQDTETGQRRKRRIAVWALDRSGYEVARDICDWAGLLEEEPAQVLTEDLLIEVGEAQRLGG